MSKKERGYCNDCKKDVVVERDTNVCTVIILGTIGAVIGFYSLGVIGAAIFGCLLGVFGLSFAKYQCSECAGRNVVKAEKSGFIDREGKKKEHKKQILSGLLVFLFICSLFALFESGLEYEETIGRLIFSFLLLFFIVRLKCVPNKIIDIYYNWRIKMAKKAEEGIDSQK